VAFVAGPGEEEPCMRIPQRSTLCQTVIDSKTSSHVFHSRDDQSAISMQPGPEKATVDKTLHGLLYVCAKSANARYDITMNGKPSCASLMISSEILWNLQKLPCIYYLASFFFWCLNTQCVTAKIANMRTYADEGYPWKPTVYSQERQQQASI
jgi:hypothetical protein